MKRNELLEELSNKFDTMREYQISAKVYLKSVKKDIDNGVKPEALSKKIEWLLEALEASEKEQR